VHAIMGPNGAGLLRLGNVLAGRVDELFVFALGALFLAVVVARPRPEIARGWRIPLLAVLALAVYLVTPFEMGYMGYIHTRAMPFIALLLIASPSIAPGRRTGVVLAAVVALQLVYQARVAAACRAFDREAQVAELQQVLRAAEPGRSLFGLVMDTGSKVVQYQPYLHIAAYYEVLRGGRSRYNFAETPWTPVRYQPGTEPVALERSWEVHPWDLDVDTAVADEDYVLVREPAAAPRGFAMVTRAGQWSLYAPAARR